MYTVGAVPYLNAVPLVADLPKDVKVLEATPAELSGMLEAGSVDAALLPVAEMLRGVGDGFVGEHGIAGDGVVESVLLFVPGRAGGALEKWPRRVVLDPASRTSAWLVRCLLARRWRIDAEYDEAPAPGPDPRDRDDAMTLVIGDAAMRRRREFEGSVVDLGAAWKEWTRLPFLFAAWTARKGLDVAARRDLARMLDGAARSGALRVADLAARFGPAHGIAASEAATYLSRSIRYVVGPREREALARFSAELRSLEILSVPGAAVSARAVAAGAEGGVDRCSTSS